MELNWNDFIQKYPRNQYHYDKHFINSYEFNSVAKIKQIIEEIEGINGDYLFEADYRYEYDDRTFGFEVTRPRKMTPQEIKDLQDKKDADEKQQQSRELAEYNRLKAKFG